MPRISLIGRFVCDSLKSPENLRVINCFQLESGYTFVDRNTNRERAMTMLSFAEICRPAAVLPVDYIFGSPCGIKTGIPIHSIRLI